MRKPTTKSVGKGKVNVTFTVTDGESKRMNAIAKAAGVSRSVWIRDAIEWWLSNKLALPKKQPLQVSLDASLDLVRKASGESDSPNTPIGQRPPKAGDGPNRK